MAPGIWVRKACSNELSNKHDNGATQRCDKEYLVTDPENFPVKQNITQRTTAQSDAPSIRAAS